MSDFEFVQQLNKLQRQVDGLVKPEVSPSFIAPFLTLPGLVGFWPTSSVQRSTGNSYDLSGQGRTLTYNGNPVYGIYNNLIPYIHLDGTADFLSRADETDLDVLGNEAIFSFPGLTLGGWFYPTSVAAGLFGLMSKYTGTQISFIIYRSGATPAFSISNTGAALAGTVASSMSLVVNTWNFIIGRFTPSTENAIFVNNVKDTNITGIPATIFNSTTAFEVGRYNLNSATCFTGYASLLFLCANALPDAVCSSLYQQTRGGFGV